MHICGDEIMAAATVLPFVGAGYYWLKEKCGLGCRHTHDAHECVTRKSSTPQSPEERLKRG